MTNQTDQAWKRYSPCFKAVSGGLDPRSFEVPEAEPGKVAPSANWDRAVAVAETYCSTCPFLLSQCAADPDGRWGIWSGSARWVRGSEVLFRKLIPGAPRPPFTNSTNVTPDPVLRDSRPRRKAAA